MNTSYSKNAVVVVLGAILIVLAARTFAANLVTISERIAALGVWGPVAFVAIYALATTALVPAGLLTLTAGAIFGLVIGALSAFLGAMVAASLSFLLSRYVLRATVSARVGARTRSVIKSVDANGIRIIFLLRLSPVIPFGLINWATGITSITFRDFITGSLGMIPVTLLYTYYGTVAGTVVQVQQGHAHHDTAYYVMLTAGLVATIVVTGIISRLAKRALDADAPRGATINEVDVA